MGDMIMLAVAAYFNSGSCYRSDKSLVSTPPIACLALILYA